MKLKKLPIGQSSFENLIRGDMLYVDKTELIFKMITTA
ncbi:MAG TPA: AAA family ATPase, partial [Spirochaetota bacterium]|nr:AAA family ATPase [Spirochaetota bacterium]HOV10107.1 AAA family ATPase [Spirochaetota bacterium]HPP95720.1 AAA family ATPase [Spirochaetota bacterium]HRS63743.1 AAA family ATPase [Spirochaetota bacterium]